jgi:uncharacterized damage-inducible protein DinB
VEGITWHRAVMQVNGFNSIAALVYHVNYYVSAVLKVFKGGPLDASDKYSFNLPAINSETDWQNLLSKTFADAENFASLVEQLPVAKMQETFVDEKYGTYYRNIQGIIEHTHYHLGQITLIKKMLLQQKAD